MTSSWRVVFALRIWALRGLSTPPPPTAIARPRIVGGGTAAPFSHGFLASLHRRSHPGGPASPQCVASLVAPRWVLTAAHCCTEVDEPWRFELSFGRHELRQLPALDGPCGENIGVDAIFKHPQNNPQNNQGQALPLTAASRRRSCGPATLPNEPHPQFGPWLARSGRRSEYFCNTQIPMIRLQI